MLTTRKEIAFMVLAGIFITSAIAAELISCKQIDTNRILSDIAPGDHQFTWFLPTIAGILPWPVVFLLTDVMNEYFGKQAVRRLSWITCGLIAFCFLVVFAAVELPTADGSYLSDAEFRKAFGGSLPIMIGSIIAFMLSQLIDVYLFGFFSKLTNGKLIWLRSTGSTVFSQLIDSYTVLIIGFLIPGVFTFEQVLFFGIMGYATKLIIAVALTPMIYVMHYLAKAILGEKPATV